MNTCNKTLNFQKEDKDTKLLTGHIQTLPITKPKTNDIPIVILKHAPEIIDNRSGMPPTQGKPAVKRKRKPLSRRMIDYHLTVWKEGMNTSLLPVIKNQRAQT